MPIQRIIYHSTATRSITDEEMDRLVSQARIYNYSQCITGILFCSGRQFLQVLEGEQDVVEPLYHYIGQDPRHTNLTPLLHEEVPQRSFPEWSMGYSRVGCGALARLATYLDPQHRAALLPRPYCAQEVLADLVREFAEDHAAPPLALDRAGQADY